ncbi:MAG: tRNA 2-thiouridine(34) synthase MnmA [Ruminococcaceae bacterium]|nr:tRNA 2-thiouridine(34) synthase MnmA [Oscillospiraceae bacterium]
MDKTLIAMSGGVDSAVAAFLIKKAGDDACGITLKLISDGMDGFSPSCCTQKDISDAQAIAKKLDIPHYLYNFCENFKECVIDKFVNTYLYGGTPNPCIDCNRYVKFYEVLSKADELGFSHVATGHYAICEYDKKLSRYLLKKAADDSKDQSYVLYSLTQKQLSKIKFPLGKLTKAEVREIASANGFINAEKEESQDICFIKDGNYATFIEKYIGKKSSAGDFVDTKGNILGKHKGHIYYTIGQRKGLGLSVPQSVYVLKKDIDKNIVTVDTMEHLFKDELFVTDVNLISCDSITDGMEVCVRTRYKQKETPARLYKADNGTVCVKFDAPVKAITPGQAAVFYDNDIVVGGGTIL